MNAVIKKEFRDLMMGFGWGADVNGINFSGQFSIVFKKGGMVMICQFFSPLGFRSQTPMISAVSGNSL